MRNARLAVFIALVLAAVGCGRSSDSSPDSPPSHDTNGTIDTPAGGGATVKSIRMSQPTSGAVVSLTNVVVVAHVTSKKGGSVWVQDQGGGQYAGIHVFCNYGGTTPNCTMTQMQFDALAVGTVVNVTGMFNSFLLTTAPAGAQPELEIEAPMITATGAMMTPVAVDVDASVIAKAQLASAAAEPYKGAYVHVTGGPFPVSNAMATEFSTTCTSSMGVAGTTFDGFDAAGGGQTLAIGLSFYDTLTYCIPECGYPCTNQVTSQSFTSVSGVVEPNYNKNGMVYLEISPVTDSDLPHS